MTSRVKKRPVRRIALALVLAAAAIGGTALTVGTANAELSHIEDGFDNNPESRWSESSTGSGVVSFSNSHASMMHAIRTGQGWTEISRRVVVPKVGKHDCFAGVAMRTMSAATVAVNVEVIDPVTFGYVGMQTAQVSGQEWKGHTVRWANGPDEILFRVSLLGAERTRSVDVDTLMVVCDHQST